MEYLLTIRELADILRCTPKHILVLRNSYGLPYLQIGGLVRFRRSDVDEWLEDFEHSKTKKGK